MSTGDRPDIIALTEGGVAGRVAVVETVTGPVGIRGSVLETPSLGVPGGGRAWLRVLVE